MLLFFAVIAAVVILYIVALWKVFQKAGKPGWHAVIPLLDSYQYYEISIGKKTGLLFFGLMTIYIISDLYSDSFEAIAIICKLFGLALTVMSKVADYYIVKSFGKDGSFAVGLMFFPIVFLPILAFGDAQYIGPKGQPINGIYANNINVQQAYSDAGFVNNGLQNYDFSQNFAFQGYEQQKSGINEYSQQQVNPFENNTSTDF